MDTICSNNGLHYFLIGANALSAYNEQTIDNGSRMVAVAMPSEDLEIFCKIVKKEYDKDRYVYKNINDKTDSSYFVAYGDKNSTFFVLSNLDPLKPHGIIIRIYPIRKSSINWENDEEQPISFYESIKNSFRSFIRKNLLYRDAFYVRYGLKVIKYAHNYLAKIKNHFAKRYPKAIIKERLYDIFGRDSYFTNALLLLYNYIYSGLNYTYFYFKNLRKHPFIETWDDLKYYDNAKIINRDLNTELLDTVDKMDVDGIDLNIPGNEFYENIFGKNYKKKKVSFKPLKPTAVLDTGTSYQKILKERKENINEIKAIQREIRKTRYEVLEETTAVNKIFKIVKMTDYQIKYQNFFERRGKYLFSLDMDDEDDFHELYHRLLPIINTLKRYSEENMTFSIDEEADSLIQNVLIKIGEEDLVFKLKELSKRKYFIE